MDTKDIVSTEPLERLIENIGVRSVFGEPTRENDTVIIPVAQVSFGLGYGGGYGETPGKGEGAEGDGDGPAEGAGGGGGAGGRATPRGYIRIHKDEVKYEPIEDQMIVPLAGIAMAAWSIFWVTATIRFIAKQVAKTKQKQQKSA